MNTNNWSLFFAFVLPLGLLIAWLVIRWAERSSKEKP